YALSPLILSVFPPATASPSSILTLSLHDALPISPSLLPSQSSGQLSASSSGSQTPSPQTLSSPPFLSFSFSSPHATTKKKIRMRSEEHTSELQSRFDLVCRLLLEKKKRSEQDAYV